MPYTYTTDDRAGCAFITWTGRVTANDFIAEVRARVRHPMHRPGMGQFVDLRDADVNIAWIDLKRLAKVTKSLENDLGAERKVAILVSRGVVFGQARIYMALADGPKETRQVFGDVEKATAWLGLAADYELPSTPAAG